jgi:hypothetical protein
LEVNIRAEWNRDKNVAEGEIFTALFCALRGILFKYGQYDARKLPKGKSIAKPQPITHVRSSICSTNFRNV